MELFEMYGFHQCEHNRSFTIEVGRHIPNIVDADDEDFVITLQNTEKTNVSIVLTKHQLDTMIEKYKELYG